MSKVSFNNNGQQFYVSVKKSVDQYFKAKGIKKTGNWQLYSKALILIPLALGIYIFLLAGTYSALGGIILSALLGFTLVSIAFNVMHDACHGSYSSRKWVNELMSLTMNALGSNAFIWKIKHNIIHHTYTNVDGIDDDIAKSPVLRLCPTQEWKPVHRYQHVYMFIVYALSTILWLFLTDFIKYFSKKIVVTDMKISLKEHVIFWVSKMLYVVFYAVLPIAVLGWTPWLVGFLVMHVTLGLTIAVVFQLAHVVEKTSFEAAGDEAKVIDSEWAIHEIKTTANFAPDSKIISWFAGGLNFQVEHHLFPRISHVHYPAISKIVKSECERFNLPYHYYPTMTEAVASHVRVMKRLGEPTYN
ncbi:MAG TPA: acyl-CoA desaturase [Chitinophagaceae bacterium]|jgi:linoleoyl-CoA desaturase|nr:acyl-CoA desaturase [Chitinophagaceae bacterium]